MTLLPMTLLIKVLCFTILNIEVVAMAWILWCITVSGPDD
jgi:hypothetical protein